MPSTDNREGFPDNPLSPLGIILHAALGIFFVGLLFCLIINLILPLRPATLAFRYFVPGYVVDMASRFEIAEQLKTATSASAGWRWLHTILLFQIVLLYFTGPAVLIRSLKALAGFQKAGGGGNAPWLIGLGLAAGVGLTFYAVVGPLISVSQKLLREKQSADRTEYVFQRDLLMEDMELMATKALAFYYRPPAEGGGGHRWMDSSGRPLLTTSDLAPGSVTFQKILVEPWAREKSHFVVTVIHPDTLIIYGRRGPGNMQFTNAVVLKSCADGDKPPGLIVGPDSWLRNYG